MCKDKFPNSLKQANTTSAFKKGYGGSKESHRFLSILPVIVKMFEKSLNEQETLLMNMISFEVLM